MHEVSRGEFTSTTPVSCPGNMNCGFDFTTEPSTRHLCVPKT